jgi:AbrB family looped-hinge helix DNA binding protein
LPDDSIIAVVKMLPRGAVQLPPEVRERLGLKPGTKLIVATAEDAVVMRKADVLLNRQPARGIVKRLKSMFSQMPIRDVEE